jgi:O-antigen/teichoic acid export membrane protein
MTEASREEILDTRAAGPRAVRGGALRLVGHVVGAIVTVASSAVVIRHLGVVDTGRFVTVMALVTIVGSVSDLGLSAFGVREYSVRPPEERRRFLGNLLGMRVAFAVAGLAVAVAFAAATDYTDVMVLGTAIAGAGMLLFVIQQSQAIPLHVTLRFGWVAGLTLMFQVGVAIGAVLLSVAGADLLPFFALSLPVVIPMLALTAIVGGRDTRLLPAVDVSAWRRMLGRVLPYSAAVILSVLYFRVAQIMVSLLSTDVETGYFGVSFRVLEAIATIPPLLVSSALPILARTAVRDAERFAYAARRVAEVMLIAGVGVAVILFLGARVAVDVVAGAGFDRSVDVLQVLAVALIGTFVIAARGYALLSLDRMRPILVTNAVALLVVFAAGVPLIDAHGAMGAAIALVAAELTLAGGYELALRKHGELGLPPLFVVRIAVAGLVAAVPPWLLGVPSLAAAAIGAVVYGAALLVLGVLSEDLRRDLLAGRDAGSARAAP